MRDAHLGIHADNLKKKKKKKKKRIANPLAIVEGGAFRPVLGVDTLLYFLSLETTLLTFKIKRLFFWKNKKKKKKKKKLHCNLWALT